MNSELLKLLVCPKCKGCLACEDDSLICMNCKLRYKIENGIPIMLTNKAIKIKS